MDRSLSPQPSHMPAHPNTIHWGHQHARQGIGAGSAPLAQWGGVLGSPARDRGSLCGGDTLMAYPGEYLCCANTSRTSMHGWMCPCRWDPRVSCAPSTHRQCSLHGSWHLCQHLVAAPGSLGLQHDHHLYQEGTTHTMLWASGRMEWPA